MRIDAVTAHRFGPLAGRRLELAPGLNVIYGPNEAGKSSWHAAITAALGGLRRGPGRGSRAEQDFVARYRPWPAVLGQPGDVLGAPGGWSVGCELTLADGRRIEIERDLAARVATVTDMTLGRDIAAEIMHAGAPDAARWLGLDRHLFALTASATQAGTLAVVDAADGLQDYLQRAMAAGQEETAGPGDGTAAAALALLDRCQREQVGMDRQGSTKPLRAAREAVAAAEHRLRVAQAAHQEQQQLAQQVEHDREVAATAGRRVAVWERRCAAAQRSEVAAAGSAGRQQHWPSEPPRPSGQWPAPSRQPSGPNGQWPAPNRQPSGPNGQWSAPNGQWPARPAVAAWLGVAVLSVIAGLLSGHAALGLMLAAGVLAVGVLGVAAGRRGRGRGRRPRPAARVAAASADVLAATDVLTTDVLTTDVLTTDVPTTDVPTSDPDQADLAELSRRLRAAQRDSMAAATGLATAEAVLAERRRASPSVPEAEEACAQAQQELCRIERLARTLQLTSEFLGSAQETVQRQAAPQLAGTMRQWLPALTGGRYRDALVDPATLQVSVRDPGGVLRRVSALSHGTAEQIYLLLRIALVRHLGADHEPAPLILDEVTVHADPDRLERLLMVLHDVSVDQQVILFTQQASVSLWAEQAMMPGADKLINLDAPSARGAGMMSGRDAIVDLPPGAARHGGSRHEGGSVERVRSAAVRPDRGGPRALG